MAFMRVSLQASVRNSTKAVRGESWTWNSPTDKQQLTLPEIATGVVAALVTLWCHVHGMELDAARKCLEEVRAGIATLRFDPIEQE